MADSRDPLEGAGVLDLATYLAAPLCATLLGEFGAAVIKVKGGRVGEHNEEFYGERLRLSRADLARLGERGVI